MGAPAAGGVLSALEVSSEVLWMRSSGLSWRPFGALLPGLPPGEGGWPGS